MFISYDHYNIFPTEVDGFLRVIKIRSTTSFGGEVDLRHVKETYGHE
jgi:hypothetical protein